MKSRNLGFRRPRPGGAGQGVEAWGRGRGSLRSGVLRAAAEPRAPSVLADSATQRPSWRTTRHRQESGTQASIAQRVATVPGRSGSGSRPAETIPGRAGPSPHGGWVAIHRLVGATCVASAVVTGAFPPFLRPRAPGCAGPRVGPQHVHRLRGAYRFPSPVSPQVSLGIPPPSSLLPLRNFVLPLYL